MPNSIIKIGTRGGQLALAQTDYVIDLLRKKYAGINIERTVIKTKGDIDKISSLGTIGGDGVFTKGIEQALLDNVIDIAVHSAKDLPSIMTDKLTIGAVPPRENCADVWISKQNNSLSQTTTGSLVGTGSPRRQAMLLNMRPDLKVAGIRGNIETRMDKLNKGEYDALIMAYAGLKRIDLDYKITEILPTEYFIPAPGQGALVVQIRKDDNKMARIVTSIDHAPSHRCLDIERLLLRKLNAGCSTPIGGWAYFNNNNIFLRAAVLDKDGKSRLYAERNCAPEISDEALVDDVIDQLNSQGAKGIIERYNEEK